MKAREYTPAALVEWITPMIRRGNLLPFYTSTPWERLRAEVLEEQHHECQICKERGAYTEADTVHHIRPVKQRPDLALTKGNLIAVCAGCHYEIHHKRAARWNDERW